MRRYNPGLLAAAAAIALAAMPAIGAQSRLALHAETCSAVWRPKHKHGRRDPEALLAAAAEKRSVRCRRNLRWAARGAFELVNRS